MLTIQNISKLNNDMIKELGWSITGGVQFVWPDCKGIGFRVEGAKLTPENKGWFKDRELCIHMHDDGLISMIPLIYANAPIELFHITPASNVGSIKARGLLTGTVAGKSTTLRKECANAIYVSLEEGHAREWAYENAFGHLRPGETWALFRIQGKGLTKGVFRDPASETGWILEDEWVDPVFLEHMENFQAQ